MTNLARTLSVVALALSLALAGIGFVQARHLAAGAQTLVICTGYGLVSITIDADGNPVEQTVPCPDCVVTVIAGLSDTVQFPDALVRFHRMQWHVSEPIWQAGAAGFWARSRAPPEFV
ncbi:hypothetical protein [Roseinatronobacter alkalisoli]|uniref:DUF2946 domain-containing protein n=1 Tax=Roseinatronobacter alkalisoli TaxID=3028235 RepID=A0ABT5TA38_9RHOB|nr:hypothetical protein [Roseinatronobacter sp. HJB301]MDD7971839.1 hypothetical protein [Roseinatronobacter sp. HJB301]